VEDRIEELLMMARRAQQAPRSYAYLPEIIETLEEMRGSLCLGDEQRHHIAEGLIRLVTENGSWAIKSVLGRRLMELANDFANE